MSAGIYNATIDQGSVWDVVINYTDSDGDPIDLTGFTAAMQLRTSFDAAAALTLTTENGGIAINGPLGQITITATAEQTGDLEAGYFVYDLELISGVNVSRLIQGQLTVAEQVTRVE